MSLIKNLSPFNDLTVLKESITYEFLNMLVDYLYKNPEHFLNSIQPPSNIMLLAAQAAVNVLLSFEHGYRMNEFEGKTES